MGGVGGQACGLKYSYIVTLGGPESSLIKEMLYNFTPIDPQIALYISGLFIQTRRQHWGLLFSVLLFSPSIVSPQAQILIDTLKIVRSPQKKRLNPLTVTTGHWLINRRALSGGARWDDALNTVEVEPKEERHGNTLLRCTVVDTVNS